MDTKWDLNDICLIPVEESDINSRSECNVTQQFNNDDFLPLFCSPMDTVISPNNYKLFINQGIIPCLPRGINPNNIPIEKNHYFQAFGLCEIERQLKYEFDFDNVYLDNDISCAFFNYPNVLIDIANAHMAKLIPIIKEIKQRWPDMKLMVGNIANPETFANLALAGADYIRCGIGLGACCITSANVSINYPMGSLISECYKQKIALGLNTKIIADGGMKNYSDIIVSLGLGADCCMCGSIFNKAIESAGFNYLWKIKINNKTAETLWRWGFPVKKKIRGMSTKAVQRNWGKTNLVTAEGITKYQKVEYTLEQWTENFKDYLRSAMSYCNAKTLDDFIGKAQYVFISEAARRRFEK
ncbi:MAG: IMP dehydrogenase [Clostridia bacterium]